MSNRQQRRAALRSVQKGASDVAMAPGVQIQVVLTLDQNGHVRMASTTDPLSTMEMLLSGLGGITQQFRQAAMQKAKEPVEDRKREYAGARQYDNEGNEIKEE